MHEQVFITHGGLSTQADVTSKQIEDISRNRQPPDYGLMCELLLSDPMQVNGRAPSKRGVGCMFGPDVTENFLTTNNLSNFNIFMSLIHFRNGS